MGDYQRDWVESAERDVADGINGELISEALQPTVDKIIDYIDQKYTSPIDRAVWTGGSNYQDPGDVHVFLEDQQKIKIELKFSKETGSGTLKNPSTNILKKQIDASILSYPEFEVDYKTKRYQLVESRIGHWPRTASEYTAVLRSFRDNNDPIIDKIAAITAPGQEAYTKYAASMLNQFLPKVNIMVDKLLNLDPNGAGQQGVLYCVIKHFGTTTQQIDFYEFTKMDRTVTNVIASGNSILFRNENNLDVVRFSTTWKNICQGGATPCFNVFIGNAFQGK